MTNHTLLSDVLVHDNWHTLPEEVREELLTRRAASTNRRAFGTPDPDRRWMPLRPVILQERAYHHLETILARLLTLAVDSCRRRATTLGELHQALRFPHQLPLMDPHGPLVAAELTRCARPDILIEQGQPRIVEFNVGARLGGGTKVPRMARGYTRLSPRAGLRPPQSTVAARTQAMTRALGGPPRNATPHRLAIPTYTTTDHTGTQHDNTIKKAIPTDARRAGFHVIQTDLADLRLDATGRLLAADTPIDLVLIPWGSGETPHITGANAGLAALRGADRAGTIELFPRTESALINSKTVLAWLHEDADADLLPPTDTTLIRTHIPRTTTLSPTGNGNGTNGHRDQMVVKPALGKAGNGVVFGSQTSPQDWHHTAIDPAQDTPAILQQRVTPDRVTMTFLDQQTHQQTTAPVPFLLSPFMIDGTAADIAVRHMTPDTPTHDVVIAVDRGGCWNTAVLLPDHPEQPLAGPTD